MLAVFVSKLARACWQDRCVCGTRHRDLVGEGSTPPDQYNDGTWWEGEYFEGEKKYVK